MKKLLSIIFALAIVVSVMGTVAFAEDGTSGTVASIGDTGFETLGAAVNAAQAGDTIRLLQDVTLDPGSNIQLSKSLTFDLNGKTLSGSVSGSYVGLFRLTEKVDLTVKNGNLKNETNDTANVYIIAGNDKVNANVTLENCNLTLSGQGYAYGVYLRPTTDTGGDITVEKCDMVITGEKASYGIYHYTSAKNSAINVKDSSIEVNTTNSATGYGIYTSTTSSVNLSGNTIKVTPSGLGYGINVGSTTGNANLSGNTINVTSGSTGYGIYTSAITDKLTLSGNTVSVQATGAAYGYYAYGAISGLIESNGNEITLRAGSGKSAYPVRSGTTKITLEDGKYTVNSGDPLFEKVTVAGGYFNFEVPVSQCKAGYYCAPAADMPGYYTLEQISPENASVVATKEGEESKYYMALSGAASECGEGWTLTVTKDFTDSSLIGSSSAYAAAAIVIKSGVTATTSSFYANNLTVEEGAAVIAKNTFKAGGVNNGTITLTDYAYTIELSNFTNNGSIILKMSDISYGFRVADKGNVVNNGTIICDGEGSNSYYQLTVSAGGITGSKPYPYTASKYYWDYNKNVWYEYYGAATIISPDGTQKHCENFNTAYDAAADGDTIRLNEVQSSARFNNATNVVEKNITVDLNGYELGANCSYATPKCVIGVTGEYTLTIIDSSEAKSGRVVAVGSPICVVRVNNGGTLILDGISMVKGMNIVYSEGGAETPDTIIVKNSTIIGTNYGINHNGSYYGADVTVENSTVTAMGNSDYSNSGAAIYLSGQSGYKQNKLKVVDSTITGPTAIETKYSDIEVINSTISTTAQTPAYSTTSNGICTMGFAVVSTDNGKANSTGSIKISGDDTVVTGYVGLEKSGLAEVADVVTDVTISGGKFSTDVSGYLEEGKTLQTNPDGSYSVAENSVVWIYDTDAGCYMDAETRVGIMRFLFAVDVADEDAQIEEVGIKYSKANNIAEDVKGTYVSKSEALTAFSGDVTGIPDNGEECNIYAVAYVKIGSEYKWSAPLSCSADWSRLLNYNVPAAADNEQ